MLAAFYENKGQPPKSTLRDRGPLVMDNTMDGKVLERPLPVEAWMNGRYLGVQN